jgi:hypothetical protein
MATIISINLGEAVSGVTYQFFGLSGAIGSPVSVASACYQYVYAASATIPVAAIGVSWVYTRTSDATQYTDNFPFDMRTQDALGKIQAAVYDSASVSGDVITLSNAATHTVTAAGRVTA